MSTQDNNNENDNQPKKELSPEELKAKEERKALKKAKKAQKAAEKAARAAKVAAQKARKAPIVNNPTEEQLYGDLKINQSAYKTNREFVPVDQLDESFEGKKVWVRARAHNIRAAGGGVFVVLRRGFNTVQACIFANRDEGIDRPMVTYVGKTPSESVLDVEGIVKKVETPTNTTQSTIELSITRYYVVSLAAALPFQIVDAMTPEVEGAGDSELGGSEEEAVDKNGVITVSRTVRLDNRWIDLRTPANHAIFRIQSGVGHYFREYFYDRNFVEVHTPKITPGVSEGGSEVFRLDYFKKKACLAQSPQLYKQMSSACSDLFKVFEIGPVFRAENSNTHRHMCEFVGLDFEMEIQEHYHEVLKVLGDSLVYIFDKLNEKYAREMEAIRAQYPFEPLKYRKETLVLDFTEAVQMLAEDGHEVKDDFSTAQEKRLGELIRAKHDTDFYIIDKYPATARPFYTMLDPENPEFTNSYDVFVRGEEITSGAQRIHDCKMLSERAVAKGIPLDNIESYLEAFKYGAPPHGGAGIGLERVVMLFLGLPNIRKTSMFPRTPLRITP